MRWPMLMLLILAAPPAMAGSVTAYTGEAHAMRGDKLLYREHQFLYRHDGSEQRLTVYLCPDGKAFARKRTGGGSAVAPDFAFEDGRSGYGEGVRESDGQREVYVRHGTHESARSKPLPGATTPVIDAGFDAFVKAHWEALVSGKKVRMDFLVPSRLRFVGFAAARHEDARAKAAGEVTFRLSLDSWMSFAVPSIDVSYDKQTHTLRRFRGLTNLRDLDGDNVSARLEYPSRANRRSVPVSALDTARALPLDGRCRLH